MKNTLKNDNDKLVISKVVFIKIVEEVIMENKNLFVEKSHLKLKSDKTTNIEFINENKISLTLDVNVKYGKNIPNLVKALQDEIKLMIEHITDFLVEKIDINIVGIES